MNASKKVKPAVLVKADDYQVMYREKSSPVSSNLDILTYGDYTIRPGAVSGGYCHNGEESLLFCIRGKVSVEIAGRKYVLSHYDTLYVPRAAPYRFINLTGEEGFLVICRAPARKKHPVFFSSWKKFSRDGKRIRRLKGKDVYLMFDVSEPADKLIAGYTIYRPFTRAWPAHNHTDQEEVYIFVRGQGAMEVYADEENKTFVTGVGEMDAVTIPVLNYHPVFSQEKELHFIWCIAGERYWVGDKNKAFMDAKTDKLTT